MNLLASFCRRLFSLKVYNSIKEEYDHCINRISDCVPLKIRGKWFRRSWQLVNFKKIVFSDKDIIEQLFRGRYEEDVQRFWLHLKYQYSLKRLLQDEELEKLDIYEKKYRKIRVYDMPSGLPIAGLCLALKMYLEDWDDCEKDTCAVFFLDGLLEGRHKTANSFLTEKIKQQFEVITRDNYSFWRTYLLKNFDRVTVITRYGVRMQQYKEQYGFFQGVELLKRKVSFIFTEEEQFQGQKAMNNLGITNPYICIFARDGQYNKVIRTAAWTGQVDLNDLRNSDVNAFKKTTEFFFKKGIQSVRMGAISGKEYCCEGAVDYANRNERSSFLDAVIFSGCRFAIGDCSGINAFGDLLNVPWVAINIPQILTIDDSGQSFYSLGIFVKYYNPRTQRYLSLREIVELQIDFESSIHNPFLGDGNSNTAYGNYVRENYTIIHNSAEEILDVAKEMDAILNHTIRYTEQDELLQQKYRAQVSGFLKVNPGVVAGTFVGRIGRQWLRDNEWFLD